MSLSMLLPVIGVGAVFALVVLVYYIIRKGLGTGIDQDGIQSHLADFFENGAVVDCFCGICAPGEGTVTAYENHVHFGRIETVFAEMTYDEFAGFFFVVAFNGFLRKIRRAGNRGLDVVGMRRAEERNRA